MHTIAFSVSKRRPGCILLQVAFGASISKKQFFMLFPTETWLVAPTDDMAVYPATEDQLEQLSNMALAAIDKNPSKP